MPLTRHHDPRVDMLARVELFRGCSKSELATIAQITTPADVTDGTVLCRQGDVGREAFVIVEGEASVTIDGAEMARLGPGSVCGEMALLDHGRRTATVTAVGPVKVLALSTSEFARLLRDAPAATRKMLVAVSNRLRTVEQHDVHTATS